MADRVPQRLFTHNLHGHQINQQINERVAGGFNTVHAGSDMFFCSDQQYIGVDLQYGPDGAVYISDWYDPRHCHSPNAEQWDRGNGRLYRLKYDATYRPVAVDYATATNQALVDAQLHGNDWHARTARLVLTERAAVKPIESAVSESLSKIAAENPSVSIRLRAIWALHGINALDSTSLARLTRDPHEAVRGWAIQLATEQSSAVNQGGLVNLDQSLHARFVEMAESDSLWVARALASAVQRIAPQQGWQIAKAIAMRADAASDRDLPKLLWHGMAGLVLKDTSQAFGLAEQTKVPELADYIRWYLAAQSDDARLKLVSEIRSLTGEEQIERLELLELALRDRQQIKMPAGWTELSQTLYQAKQPKIDALTESIGAAMGDQVSFKRVRERIKTARLGAPQLRKALNTLASDNAPENVDVLLTLLDRPEVAPQAISMLTRYQDGRIPHELLQRLGNYKDAPYSAAMEVLCSRVEWANQLLDQIAENKIPKASLTAFYARQMASLGDRALNARLEQEWGKLGQSSGEIKAEIAKLVSAYRTAPLWAYSEGAGAEHFKKLCAQCHQPDANGATLAPKLNGSGAKGVEYLAENILDPNAVIGQDFQARVLVTAEGRVVTGLLMKETSDAYTVRTLNDQVVIRKEEVDEMRVSTNSFMPEGLLKTLNQREQIELLKFLMAM